MQYPWNWKWNFNWIRRINDDGNFNKLHEEKKDKKKENDFIALNNKMEFIKYLSLKENKPEEEIKILQLEPPKPTNKVAFMYWKKEMERQKKAFYTNQNKNH